MSDLQQNDMKKPNTRLLSLDRFKGLLVIVMIVMTAADYFPSFGWLYMLEKGKNGIPGFCETIIAADFTIAGFLFLIGMSAMLSYRKRIHLEDKHFLRHWIFRNLIFLGLGSIMVTAEYFINPKHEQFTVQVVLLFATAVLGLFCGICLLFCGIPRKALKIASGILCGCLLILALLDLYMAVRDVCVIFTMPESDRDVYRDAGYMHWTVLHTIGACGLICTPAFSMKWKGKTVIWFFLAAIMTVLQNLPTAFDRFDCMVVSGLSGAFSWVLTMLGGMILIELWQMGKKFCWPVWAAMAVLTGLFVPSFKLLPVTSHIPTPSFVELSLIMFYLLFLILTLFDRFKPRVDILRWYGRNPLLIYGIGLVLKVILELSKPLMDNTLPLVYPLTALLLVLTLFAVLAGWLDRKKIYIKL